MAAQLKDTGPLSSVQTVRGKAFARVVTTCNNPPKASSALKALVARGREMRNR